MEIVLNEYIYIQYIYKYENELWHSLYKHNSAFSVFFFFGFYFTCWRSRIYLIWCMWYLLKSYLCFCLVCWAPYVFKCATDGLMCIYWTAWSVCVCKNANPKKHWLIFLKEQVVLSWSKFYLCKLNKIMLFLEEDHFKACFTCCF